MISTKPFFLAAATILLTAGHGYAQISTIINSARDAADAASSNAVATEAVYVTPVSEAPAPAATVTTTPPITSSSPSESEFTPAPVAALPEGTEEIQTTDSTSRISISLDDVELIDVVRMFSRIANANIIANPEVLVDRVTVNLDNVEWRPALSSILSMHSLNLLERPQGSGVYSITTQPTNAPIPMVVETIFLDYTTVDEVEPIVTRMLGGGSLSTFPSRNAMVIRETEDKLNEIKLVLEDIDVLGKQVVVETQFMELNDGAMKKLGIKWDSLEELGVNFQAGPFQTSRSSTRTQNRDDTQSRGSSAYNFDRSDERYDMFGDRFEGTERAFAFPDEAALGQDGVVAGLNQPSRFVGRANERYQVNGSEISDSILRTIEQSSAAILNVDSLNVVLSALKQTDGVSIVSNPKIIVASGSSTAFFNVGEKEPIIRTETTQGTADSPGDRTTANLDTSIATDFISGGYLNTGIKLEVIPTVKTDDLIEAIIAPTLTRKTGEKRVGTDGNSWPEIAVKEIRTQFTLKSGQTVAIGGLTDTMDTKRTSKVPLLGDIPIIGKYLFSHTEDAKDQQETIIFVTLALADPMNLNRNEGIPQRSELIHKRELNDQMRRIEIQEELEELRKTARKLEEQFQKRRRDAIFTPRTTSP